MKRFILILVACSILPLSACSLHKKPSGEDYYAQGQLNFDNKEYKAAIENYQHLIDQFPFSPYADDAEMKIGLAYYQQEDYAEAIGALDDFQRMHPTSKNLELVTYYIAMSYYVQMGREDQDQTKTAQALKRFQELEQRFPEGGFAQLAHEHIVVCREMLARHDMIVGNYYYKRANFRAAESRFAELMQRYPESPVAPDALYELGIALEKEGKKFSAAQAFAAVKRHFPNTSYAKKAELELKKLHQPVDTEEDPLPLVLAETGYGGEAKDDNADKIIVRQRGDNGRTASRASGYGADGLPILGSPAIPTVGSSPPISAPDPASQMPPAPSGSILGAARAQSRALTDAAGTLPKPAPLTPPISAESPGSAAPVLTPPD
jgi:outer membrane protein assembly factor BamD